MYSYQPYHNPKYPKYKFESSNGSLFETEAAAILYCDQMNAYFRAMEPVNSLPWQLSRFEYESTCTRLNIPAMSDKECDSYGVRYGDFSPPGNEPGYCVQMALAAKRLNGIEAERKAQPKQSRRVDYPNGRRLDCGHIVYYQSHIMNASLGTSCQDCYDRMSD